MSENDWDFVEALRKHQAEFSPKPEECELVYRATTPEVKKGNIWEVVSCDGDAEVTEEYKGYLISVHTDFYRATDVRIRVFTKLPGAKDDIMKENYDELVNVTHIFTGARKEVPFSFKTIQEIYNKIDKEVV